MAQAVRQRGVDEAANLLDLATCVNYYRRFTDGTMWPVFELLDGRQYVKDDGERVCGTRLPPADESAIVDALLGTR
jgi:hypothetical protein